MPFSMFCNNKGCGQTMEPYIDPTDDKVYCSSCDNEILNTTHFMKVQMKTLKQFKRKQKIGFSIKCQKCSRENIPKIDKDKFLCQHCNIELNNISEPFKLLLKEKIKNSREE